MEKSVQGLVSYKVFSNDDSGYGIFKISLYNSNQKGLTIKGPLADLKMDHYYQFVGKYVEDPQYGMQLAVETYEMMLPSHNEFIVRYLSGPSFPGIGKIMAERIVEQYGNFVLDEIKSETITELQVKGLSQAKGNEIIEKIKAFGSDDDRVSFLLAHGLSNKQIVKINKEYGEDSVEVIKNNPYRLVYDVDGIGFQVSDKIAVSLGYDMESLERKQAQMLDHYKSTVFSRGDSFVYRDDFFMSFSDDYEEALNSLIDMGELVLDDCRLYHYTQYEAENYCAQFINDFDYEGDGFIFSDLEDKIKAVETKQRITFDEQQKKAIETFFKEDLMVLTGGPGTGKSTLLSGVISILQSSFPKMKIAMCAPTGRAAKRLEELTNVQASTIHSLLKWDLEANKFGVNEESPLECDVLIIDEFSMVDVWLFHHLLQAGAYVKKFLFVGDKDQLPSVGPGFVLGDLIASEKVPLITLQRNYRQEKGSEVIDLALNFNKGHLDLSSYHKDVSFFDSRYGSVKDVVLKVVEQALLRGYTLNDIQVLAPMYAGSSGIDNLNHFLQKMCNPPSEHKREIQVGTRIFREGDKMLQLKNQAEDFVFNGDIGELIQVEEKSLSVDFDGNIVFYEPSDFINLSHAYCMSVHKAQGSEYPIVILVAVHEFGRMLSRRLYYTGATRSSKSLVLTGHLGAFETAVKNQDESLRLTYLKERLL